MEEITKTKEEQKTTAPAEQTDANKDAPAKDAPAKGAAPHQGGRPQRGRGDRSRRTRRVRRPRVRSEFDNKILGIRRVTRVVAGGRRFSFSVTLVLGNGKGQVGVGLGKASDTALAIEKATRDAKKNLITVPLTAEDSIPHESQAKYDASEILLIPTPGKGFKAGSAPRTVLELAGVKHISAKILSRSKNPLNNAQATIAALKKLEPVAYKMKKQEKKPRRRGGKRNENKFSPKKAVAKAVEKVTKKDTK
jgi:small subunit ribosomal protein S5